MVTVAKNTERANTALVQRNRPAIGEVTQPAGSPLGEKVIGGQHCGPDTVRDFRPGFSTRRGYR